MTCVLVRRERQRRKSRRWDMTIKYYFFFFVVMVQICLSSSSASVDSRRHLVFSPPRKTMLYATAPFRAALNREGDIYGDNKRVVHTGPNPLHN
ncbi:CLAVATA3/ESR [Hirschfeldia incana]|nr:CLAVATA3/ESR [Hirschfeldia incana]